MSNINTKIILNLIFIVGSIVFLYSLWLLWAKRSYRNSKKPK